MQNFNKYNSKKQKKTSRNDILEYLALNDVVHLKQSPFTSINIKRSFSSYKNLLSNHRRRLLFKNL